MRRRGRGAGDERARDQGGKALNALNTPFAGLGERLRTLPRPAPPPPPPAPRAEEPNLFAHAMEGVVPLPRERAARIEGPAPAGAARPPGGGEAEALPARPCGGGAGALYVLLRRDRRRRPIRVTEGAKV